jgi:hypothetical protein
MPTISIDSNEVITHDKRGKKLKRVRFERKRVDIEAREVRGQWAIHKPHVYDSAKADERSGWTISHTITGLRLLRAANIETARAILRAIENITCAEKNDRDAQQKLATVINAMPLEHVKGLRRLARTKAQPAT